jgi:glutaconate CoA-transferase subunit A
MSPLDVDALAALVPDGALVAMPPDNSLTPGAMARTLVRAGKRGLRLVGVPVSG